MNREKKALLLLWTYIIIFFTPKIKAHKNNPKITYNDNYIYEESPYGTYNQKDIYIISVEKAKELDNKTDNIYIIDDRLDNDPDMSICSSYKFNSNDIENILNLLIKYEEKYPSDWDRSFKSMKNEWVIHNICYFLNIQKARTEQVDFNNSDEDTYLNWLRMLKEILNTNSNELENIKTKVLTKTS